MFVIVLLLQLIVLFVSVATAAFFVASLVLSTLFNDKSDFNCAIVLFTQDHDFLWMMSSFDGVSHAIVVRSASIGCLSQSSSFNASCTFVAEIHHAGVFVICVAV
jgi:hypothetical protein